MEAEEDPHATTRTPTPSDRADVSASAARSASSLISRTTHDTMLDSSEMDPLAVGIYTRPTQTYTGIALRGSREEAANFGKRIATASDAAVDGISAAAPVTSKRKEQSPAPVVILDQQIRRQFEAQRDALTRAIARRTVEMTVAEKAREVLTLIAAVQNHEKTESKGAAAGERRFSDEFGEEWQQEK